MTNLVQSKPQSLILSNNFSVSNGLSFTFKLQAEAKAWISRGKMLLGKRIPVSTKYFDMAAKYVPANDKKLLVEVLCNRSDARQGSFDFGGALEDAKNVTKFAPELLKVYMACLFVRFCFCVFYSQTFSTNTSTTRATETSSSATRSSVDTLKQSRPSMSVSSDLL